MFFLDLNALPFVRTGAIDSTSACIRASESRAQWRDLINIIYNERRMGFSDREEKREREKSCIDIRHPVNGESE